MLLSSILPRSKHQTTPRAAKSFRGPKRGGPECLQLRNSFVRPPMALPAQADTRQAAKVSALIAAMPLAHSSISSAPGAGEGGLPGLEVLPLTP